MKKNHNALSLIRIIVILAGVIVVGYSVMQVAIAAPLFARNAKVDAEKVFKEFIADPIPDSVENISGGSFAWVDFSANLSFKTDVTTFNELVKDFEVIPRKIIRGNYFSKDIMQNAAMVFYYGKKTKPDEIEYHYLVAWNKESNEAHFYIGNTSPGISLEDKQVYEEFYSQFDTTYKDCTEKTKKQLREDFESGKIPWDTDIEYIREKYGEPESISVFEKNGKTHYMLHYRIVSLTFIDNKLEGGSY